jgi:hypothetical protein
MQACTQYTTYTCHRYGTLRTTHRYSINDRNFHENYTDRGAIACTMCECDLITANIVHELILCREGALSVSSNSIYAFVGSDLVKLYMRTNGCAL